MQITHKANSPVASYEVNAAVTVLNEAQKYQRARLATIRETILSRFKSFIGSWNSGIAIDITELWRRPIH